MPGTRFHNLLLIALTLSALSLGAHVYVRLTSPTEPVTPSTAKTPSSSKTLVANALPAAKATPLPPLQSFSKITARPLFSATRRPPPPKKIIKPKPVIASAPTPTRIETGQFTVMGIVIEENTKAALLRKGRKGEMMRVGIGQKLDGWTVEGITAGSVRLRQGDVVDLVLLRDNVLSQSEIKRLQRFKLKADRIKKARQKSLQKQNAAQRLLKSRRLAPPKNVTAPRRPVIGGRTVPRRHLNAPPRTTEK